MNVLDGQDDGDCSRNGQRTQGQRPRRHPLPVRIVLNQDLSNSTRAEARRNATHSRDVANRNERLDRVQDVERVQAELHSIFARPIIVQPPRNG